MNLAPCKNMACSWYAYRCFRAPGLCHTTTMAALTSGQERGLASLQSDWRKWLRVRHRSIAHLHGDVIQQTVADLLEWLGRQEQPLSEDDLRRVGFRVLERRAIDAYRDDVLQWAGGPHEPLAEDIHGVDRGPQESIEYAQLLKAVMDLLARLSPSDRALILRDEILGDSEKPSALTPAERKRLSRLRQELRDQLRRRHFV